MSDFDDFVQVQASECPSDILNGDQKSDELMNNLDLHEEQKSSIIEDFSEPLYDNNQNEAVRFRWGMKFEVLAVFFVLQQSSSVADLFNVALWGLLISFLAENVVWLFHIYRTFQQDPALMGRLFAEIINTGMWGTWTKDERISEDSDEDLDSDDDTSSEEDEDGEFVEVHLIDGSGDAADIANTIIED